jgi:hypothetical protein
MPTKESLRYEHSGLERRERKRPMMGSEPYSSETAVPDLLPSDFVTRSLTILH